MADPDEPAKPAEQAPLLLDLDVSLIDVEGAELLLLSGPELPLSENVEADKQKLDELKKKIAVQASQAKETITKRAEEQKKLAEGQKAQAEKAALDAKVQYLMTMKQTAASSEDRLSKLEAHLQELLNEVKSMKGEKVQTQTTYPHPVKVAQPAKVTATTAPPQPAKTPASSAQPHGVGAARVQIQHEPITAKLHNYGVMSGVSGHNFVLGKPTADGNTVVLSRATYKLPHEKAAALENFLKEHVKSSTVETKVDGDSLIVTSSPEQQMGIGQLVRLLQPAESKVELKILKKVDEKVETKIEPK